MGDQRKGYIINVGMSPNIKFSRRRADTPVAIAIDLQLKAIITTPEAFPGYLPPHPMGATYPAHLTKDGQKKEQNPPHGIFSMRQSFWERSLNDPIVLNS